MYLWICWFVCLLGFGCLVCFSCWAFVVGLGFDLVFVYFVVEV